MKKTLLFFSAIVLGLEAIAQSVVLGISPVAIQGSYDHSWADQADGWGTPDANLPNTYVQGEVVLVEDGSPGTSPVSGYPNSNYGCQTSTTNAYQGKIALVYRYDGSGTTSPTYCGYSEKAMNAQNAGAIGVIIVNREAGFVAMPSAPVGNNVTVPVVMVSFSDGELIRNELSNGPVTMFLGNKLGRFTNDVSIHPEGTLISKSTGVLSQLAQNGTEFSFDIGTKLFNDGSADQSNISVKATVKNSLGISVYDTTIVVASLASTDSVYLYPGEAQSFQPFKLSSYPLGRYTLTYTVGLDATNDEYASDNVVVSAFVVNDSLFSYGALSSPNNLPSGKGGLRPINHNATFSICNVLSDPNASRIGVEGMYFSIVTNPSDGIDITGEEVALNLFEWRDVFTDINDPAIDFASLISLSTGFYNYPANLQDSVVYGALQTPIVLENGKRYLACAQTVNVKAFFKYDTQIDYTTNILDYSQPMFPIERDGSYSAAGFGYDNAPVFAIKVFNADELGVSEEHLRIDGVAYPNPAEDHLIVSLNGTGSLNMTMTDLAGRVVLSKIGGFDNGKAELNISSLNAGNYFLTVVCENGKVLQFSVVKK